MKKITLLFSVAILATCSHAASINWTVSGSTTYVMKDYLGATYTGSVYLISAANLSTITYNETSNPLTKDTFLNALTPLVLDDTESAQSDGKKPAVSQKDVTSSLMTAGTSFTFGLMIVSEDADGNGYFKYLTVNALPHATGASADAQNEVKTPWNTLGGKTWTQGYTAVPEPSTAVLALAGLALLLKRRRA